MVVSTILERNRELSFPHPVDMDKVSSPELVYRHQQSSVQVLLLNMDWLKTHVDIIWFWVF